MSTQPTRIRRKYEWWRTRWYVWRIKRLRSAPTRRNLHVGRLKVATWTHREGRSRETYFWLPTFTLHISTHRKAARS